MKWFERVFAALFLLAVAIFISFIAFEVAHDWDREWKRDACTERCWPDDVRFVTASGKCGCAGRRGGEP